MGSMRNIRLYVLFFISLTFSYSHSRILKKRALITGEELPVDGFRAHAIGGREGEREQLFKNPSSFDSVATMDSELSTSPLWKPKPLDESQKLTLNEAKVFPPYVDEFIQPKVDHSDAWTVLQTAGLLFPDYRHRDFISVWNTDLVGVGEISQIHGVGASLAKELISISKQRQHMVETLSGFIKGNRALVEKAIELFDQSLKTREEAVSKAIELLDQFPQSREATLSGFTEGNRLSVEKTIELFNQFLKIRDSEGVPSLEAGRVGVSQVNEAFSLLDALGKQAWKRVSDATKDGETILERLLTYDTKNLGLSMIKERISAEENEKLSNLIIRLQSQKKKIQTQIDMWKSIMKKNPQAVDSTEALRKIEKRVHAIIENRKEDLINGDM
ncbi:hypothetical protein DFH28DRAFT_781 [Melampsora americana]|nr:hypothetical protein DFH28DRAFT_781 [Melampsora americana]